jgi:hypothetical protein
MTFLTIMTALKDNWRLILLVLSLGGAFWFGWSEGADRQFVKCQHQIAEIHDTLSRERDAIQKLADEKAHEYELSRIASEKKLTEMRRSLTDVLNKNVSFGACRAGSDFMHLYGSAANPDTTGRPAR